MSWAVKPRVRMAEEKAMNNVFDTLLPKTAGNDSRTLVGDGLRLD